MNLFGTKFDVSTTEVLQELINELHAENEDIQNNKNLSNATKDMAKKENKYIERRLRQSLDLIDNFFEQTKNESFEVLKQNVVSEYRGQMKKHSDIHIAQLETSQKLLVTNDFIVDVLKANKICLRCVETTNYLFAYDEQSREAFCGQCCNDIVKELVEPIID